MAIFNTYFLVKKGNPFHKQGERIPLSATITLHIGEGVDCDVHLESHQGEQRYATIRPVSKNRWVVIRRSPINVEIEPGGSVTYMKELHQGDILCFGNSQVKLQFCRDKVNKSHHTMGWIVLSLSLLVIGFLICLQLMQGNRIQSQAITWNDVEDYAQSVYKLKVDSGLDSERKRHQLPHDSLCGTAFLTEDSFLITARHCLELTDFEGLHIQLYNTVDTFDLWTNEYEQDSLVKKGHVNYDDWIALKMKDRKGKIKLVKDSDKISPQTPVYIMGYMIKENSDSLSRIQEQVTLTGPRLELGNKVDKGNSGSPVLMRGMSKCFLFQRKQFVCIGVISRFDKMSDHVSYAAIITKKKLQEYNNE